MGANKPPTFEPFGRLPTEIRSMIFAYMVHDTIESHMYPPDYSICVLRNEYQTQGLDPSAAREHLIRSPWVTINKQYCAEYLQVFVREVDLRRRFKSQCGKWLAPSPSYSDRVTDPKQWAALNNVLRLIIQRFDIAGPYAGIGTSGTLLLSRLKGICLSFHYWGSYFERGFGKTDRRQFACQGFLDNPLKCLKKLHEDYDIPSNRLSIHISYGDPSWTVLACLGTLDYSGASKHRVVSLRAVHAQIQVDDYDASVATIDEELKVLKKGVGEIIEKMRTRFQKPQHAVGISELETMINRDMGSLRRAHLRAIDQVTNFWKAPNERVEADADISAMTTKR